MARRIPRTAGDTKTSPIRVHSMVPKDQAQKSLIFIDFLVCGLLNDAVSSSDYTE